MPRAFSASDTARSVVAPLACICRMIGSTLEAWVSALPLGYRLRPSIRCPFCQPLVAPSSAAGWKELERKVKGRLCDQKTYSMVTVSPRDMSLLM
jgi:hypothetical protein